jgi:uncharacterized alpha-E superfamily protein
MLSRVAESVYWLARYIERTNGMLRILRTNYILSQDEIKDFSWISLIRTYSDEKNDYLSALGNDSNKILYHLLLEKNNGNSVINNITRARENGRAVQDHITKEVWQCLNDYYHLIRNESIAAQIKNGDPITAMDQLVQQGMLYHGIVDVTMARGEEFNFLNIGKFIERIFIAIDMLTVKLEELNYDLVKNAEIPEWRYLLYSLSGYELYLKTHRGNFHVKTILQQVLYNERFPHSILYSLRQLLRYFERLENESIAENFKHLEFLIGKAMNNVRYSTINIQDSEHLKNLLSNIRKDLFDISIAFNKLYFGKS